MNTKKKELLKEIYEKNATRNGLTMSKAELREKLEEAFPKLFKPEKYEPKVGEWVYVHRYEQEQPALVKFKEYNNRKDGNNIGFNYGGKWSEVINCQKTDYYSPATPDQVEQRLRKYALEVLGIGDDTKIEGHAHQTAMTPVKNLGYFKICYEPEMDSLKNKHGRIYYQGKWAKPLKQLPEMIQAVVDKYGREEVIKILNK